MKEKIKVIGGEWVEFTENFKKDCGIHNLNKNDRIYKVLTSKYLLIKREDKIYVKLDDGTEIEVKDEVITPIPNKMTFLDIQE